jgi:putative ABC transport system permease protein
MILGDDVRAAERFSGAYVSANVFRLIGDVPLAGRAFQADDDRPGAPAVVILGRSVWQRRYAGDSSIVGQIIRVNGSPTLVIGVMPDRSKFPTNDEVWQPLSHMPGLSEQKRDVRTLRVLGRLSARSIPSDARGEALAISNRLADAHPETNKAIRLIAVPINEEYLSSITHPAWLAFITAGSLVLLIACANVANLLLMRALKRSREMAVRVSLGATRGRLVRQLLGESVVLAMLGGALGVVLSFATTRLLWLMIPVDALPYWMAFTIDARVFTMLVAACMAASVIFGLAPALHGSKSGTNSSLKEGGRGSYGGLRARRLTSAFLAAQFALGMVFLSHIALTVRTSLLEERKDPPIDMSDLVTTSLALSNQKYRMPEDRLAFYERLEDRLQGMSAVSSAAIATALPRDGAASRELEIDGRAATSGEGALPVWTVTIGRRYFETLGLTLARGRDFNDRDGAEGYQSVIVNQQLADTYFLNTDPIGRRIRVKTQGAAAPQIWATIVGVSPNLRQRQGPDVDPIVYLPYRADPPTAVSLIVRGQAGPDVLAPVLRKEIRDLDADLPVYRLMTLEQAAAEARWNPRMSNLLITFITCIALVLATVGLYAVTAHATAQRTREIGVRIVLGAPPEQLMWLTLRRAFVQLGAGLIGGLVCVFAWERIFYTGGSGGTSGTSLTDLEGLLAAVAMLVFLGILACLVPALRAMRVNPVVALRYE